MTRQDLAKHLIRTGAFKTGKFKLTSGRESDYYVDIKLAYTDPAVLKDIAEIMGEMVGDGECLAGMELGAIPLVVGVAMETGLPFVMVRKGERGHGTGKRIEGSVPPGGNVVVIEDVVTSGGSLVRTVEAVREAGAVVTRALAVVDRQEGGIEAANKAGVELIPILTKDELMVFAR